MRIAFFGLPLAALLLQHDGHEIVCAAISRSDALGVRRVRRRLGKRLVEIKPNLDEASSFERVRDAKPDLIVSWFWTKKIPREIRQIAPLGAVGVHPSLLPRHRGPDPFFWAIDSGDRETGVTCHELEDDYDTGAILGQRAMAIDPTWNSWTLAKKLDRPSLSLLREIVSAFSKGNPPNRAQQDEAKATMAPEPDDDMLEIRWNTPAILIERRVRAASPWPGAFTEIGDEVVTVTNVALASEVPRALLPGEAFVSNGRAIVRARDCGVVLLRARIDDKLGVSRELDANDLAELVAQSVRSEV